MRKHLKMPHLSLQVGAGLAVGLKVLKSGATLRQSRRSNVRQRGRWEINVFK